MDLFYIIGPLAVIRGFTAGFDGFTPIQMRAHINFFGC
jgi:hypothetical protein